MPEYGGALLAAIGGVFLFVALYLVVYTALYQYDNATPGMIGVVFFGFAGFWLVAHGFFFIIKSGSATRSS